MTKDPIPVTLEPFTPEEEAALFDKLDVLSIPELENYIGAAQNSLHNKGLEPSWRPRVEIGLQRAETVLVRENAAAALKAAEPPPEVVVVAAKTRKTKAAAAVEAVAAEGDSEAETEANDED